jgi:hypothetical protein
MGRDLYKIQNETVEPISALLKAMVEVNYELERAWAAGWDVELLVNEDGGKVYPTISRLQSWPSPQDEELI